MNVDFGENWFISDCQPVPSVSRDAQIQCHNLANFDCRFSVKLLCSQCVYAKIITRSFLAFIVLICYGVAVFLLIINYCVEKI